jgi:hypothetical protein
VTGVVVGVSRAAATTATVHWASAESTLRGLPLRLVVCADVFLLAELD